MAVKIKLARFGKIRVPQYRVIVADARTARNGRAIEQIGRYEPKADPSLIEIDSDRAQYWLSVGAQPTEPVLALLKVTGDWQKFKGLPGGEGTLKPQPEKISKKQRYDEALAAVGGLVDDTAPTPKKKAPKKKADTPKADEAKADDAKVDEAKTADAKIDEAKAADAQAETPAGITEEAAAADAATEEK